MEISRILGDRVLVSLLDSPKATRSGVAIPDWVSRLEPKRGIVRDVGSLLTPEGKYKKCVRAVPGETVLLRPNGGMEIDADGERLFVYEADDVLAVVIDKRWQDADAEGFGRGSQAAPGGSRGDGEVDVNS